MQNISLFTYFIVESFMAYAGLRVKMWLPCCLNRGHSTMDNKVLEAKCATMSMDILLSHSKPYNVTSFLIENLLLVL